MTKDTIRTPNNSHHILFVIPEYGHRDLTEECIESIEQTFDAHFRVLIADDGYYDYSFADTSLDMLPERTIFKHTYDTNLGFAANVNRAVTDICTLIPEHELSRTYLFIVNNDIIFLENAVDSMLQWVRKYSGVCGPAILVPDNFVNSEGWGPHKQMFSPERYKQEVRNGIPPSEYEEQHTMLSGCCLCMKANTWFKMGGFDCKNFKAYYEDDDLGIRMNLADYEVKINYNAVVEHMCSQTHKLDDDSVNAMREVSKQNFLKKWPEFHWNGTGRYKSRSPITPLDARVVYTGKNSSKHVYKEIKDV